MEIISESVTSHFKSFSHLYNSMYRVFAIDDGNSAVLEMLFYSLTKIQFIHEHIYLLESEKSFLGQEKIGCLSFQV